MSQYPPPSPSLNGHFAPRASGTNLGRLQWHMKNQPLLDPGRTLVIIGANGQIGKKLRQYMEEHHLYDGQVRYCDYFRDDPHEKKGKGWKSAKDKMQEAKCEQLDVMDTRAVETFLKQHDAQVVINLAAFLSADADKYPDAANALNSEAPHALLELVKNLRWDDGKKVETVMNMSSMAAQEFDIGPDDNPDVIAAKKKFRMGMVQSPKFPAKGLYGLQKLGVENDGNKYSMHYGVNAIVPCLAGVMNADTERIANGTTEEIDKMVVNCARQKIAQEMKEAGRAYECPDLVGGKYLPAVTKDTAFAMVDSQTLPEALLLLAHQNLLPNHGVHEHGGVVHNIYEYTIGMEQVENILTRLNPDFKVAWATELTKSNEKWQPGQLDPGKVARSEAWALGMDTSSTEKLIGNFRQCSAEQSIERAYWRALSELRKQHKLPDLEAEERDQRVRCMEALERFKAGRDAATWTGGRGV